MSSSSDEEEEVLLQELFKVQSMTISQVLENQVQMESL
jgi:hypothetical protein